MVVMMVVMVMNVAYIYIIYIYMCVVYVFRIGVSCAWDRVVGTPKIEQETKTTKTREQEPLQNGKLKSTQSASCPSKFPRNLSSIMPSVASR